MSRIRTIKPDFYTAEQVMEVGIPARLTCIGMGNFADDNGVHPASPKTLKAEVFPSDDLTADAVAGFVSELIEHGLVGEFEAEDGKRYWYVIDWHRNQRIDRPTFKHPAPPTGKIDEPSTNTRRDLDEQSTNDQRTLDDRSTTEGKGKEKTICAVQHDAVSDGFAECWKAYPKREGGNSKAAAEKAYRARVKQGANPADLLAGTERYAAFVRAKGQEGTAYVKQASTFFGTGEHWIEPWDVLGNAGASPDPFLGAI
jgi:hypothetical protein